MEHRTEVLVVDDDPAIRETVATILEEEGYLVETASDGTRALAAIGQHQPQVLLLDMRMPGVDGWDVAHALNDQGVDIPIVVMTAARSVRTWAREIGAIAYLAKPFDLNDLLNTVHRLCPAA